MIDSLDISENFYNIVLEQLKTTHRLNISNILYDFLKDRIPDDICNKVNKKLYITYYNLKINKKKVKYVYKNKKEIVNTILKSSYIPFIMDGNILFKQKYIDGINPYIFKIKNNNKILHLDLFGSDKIKYLINIKNEPNNFHRILSGLLDIHNFFIKQTNTDMCSYVNDWSLFDKFRILLKTFIEKILIYFVSIIVIIKKYIPKEIEDYVLYKIFSKITYETYIILLNSYCI
jgi:hypothetical protein